MAIPHPNQNPVSTRLAARETASLAASYAFQNAQPDGHWYGEMQSNSTITAEYVFMCQAMGIDLVADTPGLRRWLLADQNANGSWSLGYGLPGDVSTTAEAYLALRILGVPSDIPLMRRAREFVLGAGGIARVRIFTRIFFAMFGLFPWKAVPQLPPELILLPSSAPISIYRLSSWARITVVPLLVIADHQPIFPLPNGTSLDNTFLDQLWRDPGNKMVPYTPSLFELWRQDGLCSYSLGFAVADKVLSSLKTFTRYTPFHAYAVRKCMEWTLERQEESGDFAGIFPPMVNALIALHVEGYALDSDPIRRGLGAMERFAWRDTKGMRIQPCVSPVWDTILMTIGLCDLGIPRTDKRLERAMMWVKERQILDGPEGDWRVYRPRVVSGGWAFEYDNSWYPDIDDTAAAIIGFVKQDPESCCSHHVVRGLEWILGMQNADGGWAAFDVENDKLYLNRIPFSDMESLCDPSTSDVTGRVVEAFGIVCRQGAGIIDNILAKRLETAIHQAITFLSTMQEPNGAWWGRWGVNFVYGTSNVLCALSYSDDGRIEDMVKPAVKWLRSCQQDDGGWGEALGTYHAGDTASEITKPESTPSQTAWALMGLLAHLPASDEAIRRGIHFLIDSQIVENETGYWSEPQYTGTGFPGHFYLHYDLYRHYFPLMALGRYMTALVE